MTDLSQIKTTCDLTSMVPDMKSIGPHFFAGPCPFCGGSDRFQIKKTKDGDLWICRQCGNGKYQDVIEYIARINNIPLHSSSPAERWNAMQAIAQKMNMQLDAAPPKPRPEVIPTARTAPDWQTAACDVMNRCKETLWGPAGQRARDWLQGPERMLSGSSLQCWDIGYSIGFDAGGIWIPRGIVIPCFENGEVWYFKIRLLPGDRFKCSRESCKAELTQPGACPKCAQHNKYRGVKNNQPGLFGAGTLNKSTVAFIAEGEFDAMQLWDALCRMPDTFHVGVITTGATSHFIDPLTWGRELLNIKKLIPVYDLDAAGGKAFKKLAAATSRLTPRASLPAEIDGKKIKDVTDFVKAGGDLRAWIGYQLESIK